MNEESPPFRFLKMLVSVIAIVYPLTGVPQVYKIWTTQDAAGVSLLTWGSFLVFTIPLILYAILRKEYQLAVMWGFWIAIYIAVIAGTILYA